MDGLNVIAVEVLLRNLLKTMLISFFRTNNLSYETIVTDVN